MTEACIVGWAHSPFGKLDDPDIESLIGRVAGAAIADAGIAPHEIEGTFLSLFNNGFSNQDFPSSLVLQHLPELRYRPSRGMRTPVPRVPPPSTARGTSCSAAAAGSRWSSAWKR